MEIRRFDATDRPWVEALLGAHFGSTRVVSHGVLHHAPQLPGFVAVLNGAPVGLGLYRLAQDQCEVVVLIAAQPRRGVGHALLQAVRRLAEQAGCSRLWLVTTNDNQGAQAFYQAQGMRQVAIHRGAVAQARVLKPEIPLIGENGIPIEDEIEYELMLDKRTPSHST